MKKTKTSTEPQLMQILMILQVFSNLNGSECCSALALAEGCSQLWWWFSSRVQNIDVWRNAEWAHCLRWALLSAAMSCWQKWTTLLLLCVVNPGAPFSALWQVSRSSNERASPGMFLPARGAEGLATELYFLVVLHDLHWYDSVKDLLKWEAEA